MSKLLKAQKSAQKKVKSLREDLDGDELQSKAAGLKCCLPCLTTPPHLPPWAT